MANTDTSSSHLSSISHDPMDEKRDRSSYATRSAFDWTDRMARGRAGKVARSVQAALPDHPLRPILLAGAIGLFAAWVVSGLSNQPSSQRNFGLGRDHRNNGSRSRSGGRRYDVPEGNSSPEDFSLDAMNP